MEAITNEIERALKADLYYLAVAMSLCLPDICAALESPNGRTNGEKYKAWYDAWLAVKYPRLTSEDAWSLRCGVLHQGRLGHPNSQYGRVLFLIREKNVFMHNNIINDALQLSAARFCGDVVGAVANWYAAKNSDPNVQANLPRLVQLRENGLAPYILGLPIIA